MRSSHGLRLHRSVPGQHELRDRVPPVERPRDQPLVRVEQRADVLSRLERPEEQHVADTRRPARGASRARPANRP